ncbi:UNVERIFIED_CONTAM: hypothetical protein Sindi_2279600 [Sesamum indicum]
MSAAGGRKRGRVYDFNSEAHHTVAGPSQPSRSTAPLPSPPQPQCSNLDDRVLIIEQYIRSIIPNWLDHLASQPTADPQTPESNYDDNEHA